MEMVSPLLEVLNECLENIRLQGIQDDLEQTSFTNRFNSDVNGDNEENNNKEKRKTIMKKLKKNMIGFKPSRTGQNTQLLFVANTRKGQHPKNMQSFFTKNENQMYLNELHQEFDGHVKRDQVIHVFNKVNMVSIGNAVQNSNTMNDNTEAEKSRVGGTIIFEMSKTFMEIQENKQDDDHEVLTIDEVVTIFLRLMQICKFANE